MSSRISICRTSCCLQIRRLSAGISSSFWCGGNHTHRDQQKSRYLLQKPMGRLYLTLLPASPTTPLPGSPANPLEMGTVEPHSCQGLCRESQNAPTHVDLEDGGAHGGVLKKAYIVQCLAENGAIVVLVDEVNLHTCEANMVWNALICKELGKDRKQREGWRHYLQCLGELSFLLQ